MLLEGKNKSYKGISIKTEKLIEQIIRSYLVTDLLKQFYVIANNTDMFARLFIRNIHIAGSIQCMDSYK